MHRALVVSLSLLAATSSSALRQAPVPPSATQSGAEAAEQAPLSLGAYVEAFHQWNSRSAAQCDARACEWGEHVVAFAAFGEPACVPARAAAHCDSR